MDLDALREALAVYDDAVLWGTGTWEDAIDELADLERLAARLGVDLPDHDRGVAP